MKMKRSIVIFPQFDSDTDLIQNIRQQYDPLADKIAPHITLVFPFESEISSDALRQHIENSLDGFKSFSLSLQGISQEEENYLFLNIIKGQEQIIKLHDLLYSGILKQFLSEKHQYKPHVTVGRFQDLSIAQAAMNELKYCDYEFKTKINKVTTEIILEDFSSKIDFVVKLT